VEISERYQLEKRLGSQRKRKFGELFLATDSKTGSSVVLKAVRLDQNNSTIANRLRAEASFSFDFKGLPRTLHFEESSSILFLVREYFEGIPLDEYWRTLKRKQRMPFLLDFLKKLRPIFDQLKQLGVVHCDIKPSNFLIEQQLGTFEVHLLDFGLSIRSSHVEENRQRKLLFPLGYAAPELLLNHLDIVDQRTDIFALGIVIWRLYAGSLPLVHPNPSVFTNLQLTHPLPEHSEISKKIYLVLFKMANKHQFKIPPNKMDQQEVNRLLVTGMDVRFESLEEVIDAFELIAKKKFWR
jgi:serine/threonine protein kinase